MDPRWHSKTPTDASLHVVTNHEDARRALRRAVELRCDLKPHYAEEPEEHVASDVSPYGMWVDTPLPLHPGAEVVVRFRPPRYEGPEMIVLATVSRVVTGRRRGDRGRLGMALEFLDLTDEERGTIAEGLVGIAPRLERGRFVA